MEITTEARRQTSAGRFYEVDGLHLPSVTTILSVLSKPALIAWAANEERKLVMETSASLYEDVAETPRMSRTAWITTMLNRLGTEKAHRKLLRKAADIGTQAHALIEWTLKAQLCMEAGPSPHITDKAQWGFMAWEDWKKKVNLKPLLVEQVVYSRKYGYAGTLDLYAEANGILGVDDWKTGKAVYDEAHLQNAALRHALREMGHGDPKEGWIIRLPKVVTDPEFEAVKAKDEDAMFKVFLHVFEAWKWQQEMDAEYRAFKEAKKAELAKAMIPAA